MQIKDLVVLLLAHNPEANVYFMTTRKQPFENGIVGVVGRHEMADQEGRNEYGVEKDDVFLTVGRRLRPGSLSAWILPERAAHAGPATLGGAVARTRDQAIASIADEYMDVHGISEPGAEHEPAYTSVDDVRRGLEAAYHAGIAAALRHFKLAAPLGAPAPDEPRELIVEMVAE